MKYRNTLNYTRLHMHGKLSPRKYYLPLILRGYDGIAVPTAQVSRRSKSAMHIRTKPWPHIEEANIFTCNFRSCDPRRPFLCKSSVKKRPKPWPLISQSKERSSSLPVEAPVREESERKKESVSNLSDTRFRNRAQPYPPGP